MPHPKPSPERGGAAVNGQWEIERTTVRRMEGRRNWPFGKLRMTAIFIFVEKQKRSSSGRQLLGVLRKRVTL
jgi:hypothetical protein